MTSLTVDTLPRGDVRCTGTAENSNMGLAGHLTMDFFAPSQHVFCGDECEAMQQWCRGRGQRKLRALHEIGPQLDNLRLFRIFGNFKPEQLELSSNETMELPVRPRRTVHFVLPPQLKLDPLSGLVTGYETANAPFHIHHAEGCSETIINIRYRPNDPLFRFQSLSSSPLRRPDQAARPAHYFYLITSELDPSYNPPIGCRPNLPSAKPVPPQLLNSIAFSAVYDLKLEPNSRVTFVGAETWNHAWLGTTYSRLGDITITEPWPLNSDISERFKWWVADFAKSLKVSSNRIFSSDNTALSEKQCLPERIELMTMSQYKAHIDNPTEWELICNPYPSDLPIGIV